MPTQGGPRWSKETTHPECARCKRAAAIAKNDAIAEGLDTATWTRDGHTATVFRPVKYIDKTRGQR